MKIKLVGDWVASCEVEVKFKGYTLTGYWSAENGYSTRGFNDLDMSDDDRDEMERLLQDAETPVIRFTNGTYETAVFEEV